MRINPIGKAGHLKARELGLNFEPHNCVFPIDEIEDRVASKLNIGG
jgi:hypothetical protein